MKIIFNDATEINVQRVEPHGEYLRVLAVGNTPEQLKVLFTDASRTARMIVQERDGLAGTCCPGTVSHIRVAGRAQY